MILEKQIFSFEFVFVCLFVTEKTLKSVKTSSKQGSYDNPLWNRSATYDVKQFFTMDKIFSVGNWTQTICMEVHYRNHWTINLFFLFCSSLLATRIKKILKSFTPELLKGQAKVSGAKHFKSCKKWRISKSNFVVKVAHFEVFLASLTDIIKWSNHLTQFHGPWSWESKMKNWYFFYQTITA